MMKTKKAFISIFAIFFSAIVVSILTALYVLLVKQIEMMNLDSASFQAMYVADSAFECALYKEQNASSSNSVFLPAYSTSLGYCGVESPNDTSWQTSPLVTNGRSNSVINMKMTTSFGEFCAVVTTGKQVDNSEISSSMSIAGQSRACTDTVSKVIERVIDFFY